MQVAVSLLGGFTVAVDADVVADREWRSRRARQLVALLALAPNRRLTTEQVMDALWPDLTPDAARANLHKTATLARQALGSKDSVVLRGDVVSLWPSADVDVDAVEFERDARAALASGAPGACADVAGRFGGELLPDERYEEWAVGPRERLRALYLDVLRGGGLWAAVAEAEPTDEAAHRGLMSEHLRAGQLHAAIRQFQRLRTVLARELGVLPSPETVALYREIVGTAQSGWVRPGLVGREVELVRARATLRRATEGRPAAIFVTGPPGIGKTRLCEELVEQAAGDGWFVLRAAGREQTASVPYWPLVEAVNAAMVERPGLAESLHEPERALLARLSGLAGDHQREPVHRHAVLHLFSRVLAAVGASAAILFLDDLQYADDDTLALAEVLASAATPRGALLLATYRPGDGRAEGVARAMVARGVGVEIALGPLNRSESDAMVVDLLNRPVSPVELDLAWELSEGNPFFALEVAAAVGDEQPRASGAQGAVDVRLERLAPDVRDALRSVAVVAHQFTADEFAALAGLDGDRAIEHLDVAMAVGVVARQGSSYRFRHDLVCERLTATVSPAERAAAHAAAAGRLAALGVPPARVVHHLLAAGREREALPWLRRAAEEAMQVGAHADALAAVDRALAIEPRDPALLAARADAMNGLGDPGAPAAYSLAMAVSAEPDRGALAVRRAKALIYAGDVPAALETLATVESVPPPALGQLWVTRGLAWWCTGALDEAQEAGLEAKRLAETSGSVRDFVDATMVLAMVAHERGAWPQRVSLDLLDVHVRPDLAAVVMDAHLCLAESYLYGGVPYAEVIEFAHDLRRQAAAASAPRAEAFATTLLGEAHLLTGHTEEAAHHLRSAAEQHRRVGVLCGQALSLQRLAEAALAQGNRTEAQAALSGALTAARGSPVGTRHLLDRVHGTAIRSAPDPPSAVLAVDEATRAVRGPFETCPPCSINLTVPAAIACANAGDLERATRYLAVSEQVVAAFYPKGGWQAALDEARGHLERAKGNEQAARRLLAAAADAFERWGQRLDADRCRRDVDAITDPAGAGKV
ncbi:MAG TPA: AAA family ATPase [Acidimicrobiales bacterium]|nr:AAA family ATPase [Acidimicrobiales bacterium]